jgi:thiol-disulfide isomerase/thioredoxin
MSLNVKNRIFLMIGAMIAALILSYVLWPASEVTKEPAVTAVTDAKQLPAVTFYDENGAGKTLADYQGRVLLVNLWAIWCPPCVVELPALDRLQAKLNAKGLDVLTIAIGKHTPEDIRRYFEDKRLDHLPILNDQGREIATKWLDTGIPVTYLIDRQGNVIERFDGAKEWEKPEIMQKIQAALDQK